jgi:hypothetical protein
MVGIMRITFRRHPTLIGHLEQPLAAPELPDWLKQTPALLTWDSMATKPPQGRRRALPLDPLLCRLG